MEIQVLRISSKSLNNSVIKEYPRRRLDSKVFSQQIMCSLLSSSNLIFQMLQGLKKDTYRESSRRGTRLEDADWVLESKSLNQ